MSSTITPSERDEAAEDKAVQAAGIPDRQETGDQPEAGGETIDYDIIDALPEGVSLSGEDHAVAYDAIEWARGSQIQPDTLNGLLGEFVQLGNNSAWGGGYASDEASRDASFRTLEAEWGRDFERNIETVSALVDGLPGRLRDYLMTVRNANDDLLINDPKVASFLLRVAQEHGSPETFRSRGAPDMAARKAEIREVMRTDINRYFKEGMDGELTDILRREEASARRNR